MVSVILSAGSAPSLQDCIRNDSSVKIPAKKSENVDETSSSDSSRESQLVNAQELNHILEDHGFIGRNTPRKQIIKLFIEHDTVEEIQSGFTINLSASGIIMGFCRDLINKHGRKALDAISETNIDIKA